jgi:hypothetical protein
MSCPFAGLATRYTEHDERVSVRVCGAVPYERDADPDDLPLPSVCFSMAAWQSCPHYLRLIQRKEIAQQLGLLPPDPPAELGAGADEYGAAAFEFREGDVGPGPGQERRGRGPLRGV